ncbi:MAG: DmsE family decaheme c-type cytochrome [Desulfobulbaceae bacterium]|nr:DmsE family decaheme c-type cytochrome [Desulfobulbaceae bacterium]
MPNTGKKSLLLIIVMTLFWGVSPAMEVQADSIACADCHEKITADFQDSYHGRAWTGKKHSCQSCHGDTARHLDDPSQESILSFGEKSRQTADELNKMCLGCHESSSHISLWDMSKHNSNDLACINCHDIHTRKSEVAQPKVCFNCHSSVRMDAGKISHHPIVEGKIECSDCHNTHGSLSHGMLVEDDINQLCYRCHAEKRGPFVWEHPPVEEDCSICHAPHGSRHENLMKEKVSNLCQDCHNANLHSGRAYDGDAGFAATGRAGNIGFIARSCLNCHGNIHGSTHFENHVYTR